MGSVSMDIEGRLYYQLETQRRSEGYGLDSGTTCSALLGIVNLHAWLARSFWKDQGTIKAKTCQSLENL